MRTRRKDSEKLLETTEESFARCIFTYPWGIHFPGSLGITCIKRSMAAYSEIKRSSSGQAVNKQDFWKMHFFILESREVHSDWPKPYTVGDNCCSLLQQKWMPPYIISPFAREVKCCHEEKRQSVSFVSWKKSKIWHRYSLSVMITRYLFSEMNWTSSAVRCMSSPTLESLI